MTEARRLFENLREAVCLELPQGLLAELAHILPSEWEWTHDGEGLLVRAERSREAEGHVWRVIRFLSYRPLLVLRVTEVPARLDFELVTCRDDGAGFRLLIQLNEPFGG